MVNLTACTRSCKYHFSPVRCWCCLYFSISLMTNCLPMTCRLQHKSFHFVAYSLQFNTDTIGLPAAVNQTQTPICLVLLPHDSQISVHLHIFWNKLRSCISKKEHPPINPEQLCIDVCMVNFEPKALQVFHRCHKVTFLKWRQPQYETGISNSLVSE